VQVLDALADVLQLDEDATAYLHGLSRPTSRRIQRRRTEQVPTGIVQLLQTLPMPAFVQNRYMDVLAANPVAEALSPNMRPGVNRLRAAFLDPRDRELHRDWEAATVAVVAQLRSVVGPETDDPRLAELIGEVSMKSDRFRRLWARHDVRHGEGTTSLLHHAEVGDLDLRREKLAIPGTDGQLLVIYHATPGTGAEQALALLGSLAASKNVRSGDDAEMNSRREQPRNR
jgi:hypothetical protein